MGKEREIDLRAILQNQEKETILDSGHHNRDIYPKEAIYSAMREACKQVLEIAKENAKIRFTSCGDSQTCGCQGQCDHPIACLNKESITNTINQVKG